MNLHLARMFHAVASQGGFSRAAELLCVSQSAVSKGVKELELQLGLALVDRAGRGTSRAGIHLTEAGQAMFEHLKEIFALEHAALEDVHARTGLRQGTLVIGASTTVAGYWLPPLLAVYRDQHPDIELKVVVGNTQFISEGLLDCHMDLALVEGVVDEAGIVATVWQEEALAVVSAAGWPALAQAGRPTLQQLGAEPWLVREAGSGTGEVAQRLLRACGVTPSRTLEIGSNEGIARAVAQGLGLALLPACMVQDLIALKRLAQVQMPLQLSRPLYRLRRAKRPLSPAAQAFSSLLDA
ncbi:LysR family transcriptional regulator [Pusillimonas sp. CC-YST705]|uniref:LysR family transcriptional regulator n=1 Tax=Mesopusillimonas faecipullorum TaxID=2755040 RepID=A0ABS8CAM0_9BURK|nr:LysR family transcriptional regulator [Mesopusillimonas faecipullorum]